MTTTTPTPTDIADREQTETLDIPAPEVVKDDLPEAKTPRRRRTASKPTTAKATPAKPATRRTTRAPQVNIAKSITELYGTVALGLAMVPSAPAKNGSGAPVTIVIATSIMENAEAAGKAWETLAQENDQVRQTIERILTVSVFGALITAHMPILMAAGMATGIIPPAIAGMLTPQETPAE